ncbi:MAG: hypothetical protein QOK19_2397 [Solirubrobacteraceae bacterium]|jgi:hypothetical protein|nr:hypothetical protein [Solirubrobacteraceae bacterium]
MWSFLQGHKTAGLPWVSPTARVMHGLLVAAVGALALVLFWAKRRQTRVGLAAASAALLLAIEMCLSYYAFSYVLWFAPLVLIAALGKPGQLPNAASSSETEAAPDEPELRHEAPRPRASHGNSLASLTLLTIGVTVATTDPACRSVRPA